jgi:hypothetical protein
MKDAHTRSENKKQKDKEVTMTTPINQIADKRETTKKVAQIVKEEVRTSNLITFEDTDVAVRPDNEKRKMIYKTGLDDVVDSHFSALRNSVSDKEDLSFEDTDRPTDKDNAILSMIYTTSLEPLIESHFNGLRNNKSASSHKVGFEDTDVPTEQDNAISALNYTTGLSALVNSHFAGLEQKRNS